MKHMATAFRILASLLILVLIGPETAQAQTITASNVKIEWKVSNRFRLFKDAKTFAEHENAWQIGRAHV